MEQSSRHLQFLAVCGFLFCCQLPTPQPVAPQGAGQFYVSPSGSPGGDGSQSRPWDLITALNHPTRVHPGNTIWVRGGTYRNPGSAGFASQLKGTAANPIMIRNYNGERATLDGMGAGTVLPVYGSYTWYWGLEITDSSTTRTTTIAGSFSNPRAAGVASYGAGNKFINMAVHDAASGFGGGAESPDTEYYGNLVYYNGWIGPDRRHGHGFYLQNQTGLKVACDNFVGDNAEEGFQIYGSGSAYLVGFRLFGNVTYNTSSWPTPNYQYNYILTGGGVSKDIQIENAYSFFTPQANYGFMLFGLNDISVKDSVFVGGQIGVNFQGNAGPVVFTGNHVYNQPSAVREITFVPSSQANYAWDQNTYYGKNNFYDSGSSLPFPNWQQATGFDKNSTFTSNAPTGAWVHVRPNIYEAKRANIIIYNWDLAPTVSVDLSGVLRIGDRFQIQDAQNFYGPAVAVGTYSGKPVSIPMTGLTKEPIIGSTTPAHTAPLFGTFVLLGPSSSVPPPPPPQVAVSIAPTSAVLPTGGSQQFSATVTGTTNTTVTWSASGGTVSSSGLYTAPSTAGIYTVTAASAADPTKSAKATVTVTTPTPPGSIPSSPAAYWTFDAADVSGTTTYDRSGNGLNLTTYHTTSIPGVVNQALHFSGINSYAKQQGVATLLDLNTDMTLAAWVRTTNSSRLETVISKYDAAGIEYGYLLRTTPAGVAELQVGHNNLISGNRVTTDVTKINDGNWHHLAVVIQQGTSGSVTFYVDGVLSSNQPRQFKAGGAGEPLQLGLNPWSPYGNYFTGDLDQVVVYKRALSASEVAALTAH